MDNISRHNREKGNKDDNEVLKKKIGKERKTSSRKTIINSYQDVHRLRKSERNRLLQK